MNRLIQLFLNFFHTYKQRIYKISALALVFLTGCFLSFTTGRRLGQRSLAPVPKPTAISTPSTAETLNGTPHFEFPPSASYSDATPSNADLMSPDILNLAYLYEDGADTTQPSYSYAGRLYDQLSGMDAKWSSGIYDLYHYTPERLAGLLGLPVETVTSPSGVIPEFKNVNLQFLDGDGQASGSTSNARSIVSMANILYYHGILNDMGQLKAYVSDMWEASHSYSVHMGEIYYCDGSCLEQGNVSADISADAGTSLVPAASENMESADPAPPSAPPSPSSLETEETAGSAQSGGGDGSETGRADDNAETAAAQTDPSSNHHSKGPGETISTDAGFEPETAKAQEPPVNPCPGHMDFPSTSRLRGLRKTTDSSGRMNWPAAQQGRGPGMDGMDLQWNRSGI